MSASASRPTRSEPEPERIAPAIVVEDLRFSYRGGAPVLDIPVLRVERGERIFVFGPSGSGKTTLLGLLAGVLEPQEGTLRVLDTHLSQLSPAARDSFRAEHIGYIFQMFNLIPYLTVRENITLPCRLSAGRMRRLRGTSMNRAAEALADRLEIAAHLDGGVNELSVGQQQRVAAARALIGSPELVIADEPTSSLDADRRMRFLELLFEICGDAGSTLVFVSHDRQLQPMFDRGLSLPDLNRATAFPA